ncbi:putative disease resistance protein At4g11170 isoform X2 [Malus domestica]
MHDLIRDMGREIVRAECAMEPGKRSRLWHHEDVTRVLRDESLPKKLKFLCLDHSRNLTRLPDFSKLPHLENLSLIGCKSVSGGYHFFAQLKMLQYLRLADCNITDDAILESLRSLSSLRILGLDGNGFNRLPILSGLSQLTSLYLNHCTNLQAIPDLPTSLRRLEANYCTELEIMPGLPEMSKMIALRLKDCRKLKDIPNLDNFLCKMHTLHMQGCATLTATFKENILLKWKGDVIGGLSLCVNDIPRRLPYVAREDETVKIEVPATFDYIGGLVVCIIYSSDNSECTGSLRIHVVNRTQRTRFHIWPMETTVTASHECYLWLGNLTNKKLNLKGGDKVRVHADFNESDEDTDEEEDYQTAPYESDEEEDYQTAPYESDEEASDDDKELSDYSSDEVQPYKRFEVI